MKRYRKFILQTLAIALTGITGTHASSADSGEGRRLFIKECEVCHGETGYGTMMLARRLGDERSLLRARTDLIPVYIATVVRKGLASMPALSRVEVADGDLEAIISFLTRAEELPPRE